MLLAVCVAVKMPKLRLVVYFVYDLVPNNIHRIL